VAEVDEFLLALDVEEADLVVERVADLGVGLPDAREDDHLSAAARGERTIEFAATRHVEPGAVLGHQPGDVDVSVSLEAVTNQRLRRGEGRLNLLQMMK